IPHRAGSRRPTLRNDPGIASVFGMKTLQTLAVSAAALLAANAAFAKVVTKSVVYEHAGTKLEGFLAYDDAKTAKGKLPGVLVIPEWWGLNAYAKGRAVEVAAIGFCFGGSSAQALAYSGVPLAGIVSFHGGPVNAPASAAGTVKAKFLLLHRADDPMVKAEARG